MRRSLLALVAALVPALAASQAAAREWQGTVRHVTDGDTVWVHPAHGGEAVAVRLHGIDAPEICQEGGPQARDALAQRLQDQPVTVVTRGKDDYGRTLARLQWGGMDVGAWLVFNGLAWSYAYRGNPGPYADLQSQARDARRGIWSLPQRQASPREFRKRHGSCHAPDAR
jgi:endonuclease YncB( thermonuclease family)